MSQADYDSIIRFMLKLAEALHRFGAPAYMLEDLANTIGRRLGIECQFASMPTQVIASFGHLESQRTYLVRVVPGELDLNKQVLLGNVAKDVIKGRMNPRNGETRVEEIIKSPSLYGDGLTMICYGTASGVAARFFGGGWREILASLVAGLLVGVLAAITSRTHQAARVFEASAAVIVTALAIIGAVVLGPMSTTISIMGGIVVLLPGFTVTVAMGELASRHLISGTVRLMGAMTVLLVIVMGVTFGELAAGYFFGINRGWMPIGLPWWTETIAVAVGMFSYTILLRAPFGELPYILMAGAVTYLAITIGNIFFGPDIAAGIAALVLGIYGNLYSRLRGKQASITIAPAVLYLVPGSLGLKSVFSIMEKNVFSGIETAFQMGMMALFIATGLLVANLILPSKKIL